MRRVTLTLLLLGAILYASAQSFDYTTPVGWSDKPSVHPIPPGFDEASAVTVLDERSIEYRREKDQISVYEIVHKIIHIHDDKGIEMFNKVYLPVQEGGELSDIRARTILPGGKVLDVTQDKIKTTQEDGTEYRQFAMNGVEKGAEVEYYYTEKRPFYLFGSLVFQSGQVPVLKSRLLLITPRDLRFSAKSYNGFAVSLDTLIGEQRIIAGQDSNRKDLPEEKYAFRDAYLARVDFKLSYNMANNPFVRLYTWKELAKKAYAFYTDRTDKDEKALRAFADLLPAPADTSLAGRISSLEDYIKTNINIDKKLTGNNGGVLPDVLTTRNANEEGVIRLFTGLLDDRGIPYQLVLASDRAAIPLDPDLEDWDRAENILLYFPGTGLYLDPSQAALRYPYIRPTLGGARGIFLKTLELGTFKTAMASFGMVNLAPADTSALNLEADLHFNPTLDTLLVHGRQIMKGYGACEYRPIYTYLPKEKQDEANKDICKSIGNSADVSNIRVTNTRMTDCLYNLPLMIDGDIRCPDLIENAGPRILLKIGEIIGTQTEMYQERPRQTPVEMPYPHEENRLITLHIPDGYTVKNLKDLIFNVSYPLNNGTPATGDSHTGIYAPDVVNPPSGVPDMGFVSSYTLNGSVLVIDIRETYRKVFYPLDRFDQFRKVINASADFNKVVLVLEKTGNS